MNLDSVMLLIVLLNLAMLGTHKLSSYIKVLAAQGVLIALIPMFVTNTEFRFPHGRELVIVLISIVIKSVVFPLLLTKAINDCKIRSEVKPFVGYSASVLIGIIFLSISFYIGQKLQVPVVLSSTLLLPSALSSIMIGIFVIISRRLAITQAIGYLLFENGVYAFGMGLIHEVHFVVELGILLDVFAGVFIMGLMIFNLNKELDHVDTKSMTELKEF